MRYAIRAILAIALIGAALWFGASHKTNSDAVPGVADASDASARGGAAFIGAAFGGLSLDAMESHALPWKLVMAALVADAIEEDASLPADLTTAHGILARFGFLPSARVANRPAGVGARPGQQPLGVTHGMVFPLAGAPLEVANLGCAACHAGVTYDAAGNPQPGEAWIGMPNTSLNLEAYTVAIFAALRSQDDPHRLLDMVATLYPETGWRERQTLRWLVLPLVRARLNDIDGDRPLPFPNGVPGSTNGVAALKHIFAVPLIAGGPGDAGIVSIPDLGYRHWRNSLLADGAYAIPGQPREGETTAKDNTPEKRAALATITTFFTVPSMGVDPTDALASRPLAEDIYAFLDRHYAPQPFPGAIDRALVTEGYGIFAAECSACHGTYVLREGRYRLQSLPNWLGDVGTDPLRAEAFSPELAEAFGGTPYRDQIDVEVTGGYVAPPLAGIWASAPYLHNGSIPTIWALLTPDARPEAFELGGHALDFAHLGLRLDNARFPEGYVPFSQPVLYRTDQPGQGNAGHVFGSELSDREKRALIEFLKGL